MEKHVHPLTTLMALAMSAGLIALALAGADVAWLGRVFLGGVLVVMVSVLAIGSIASLFHR